MAPSHNYIMITLFVAFTMVAPTVQPSAAATRVEVAAKAWVMGQAVDPEAAENPAAAPASDDDVDADDGDGDGDGDFLPPLPPQPAECRSSLMPMVPYCTGFLTNSSVFEPPTTCCDGFNSIRTPEKATCMCHVANGDIAELLPTPLHHMRLVELFSVCGLDIRVDIVAALCNLSDGIPPMDPPGTPPPAPRDNAPSPAPSA
ncbi:hypothetical protein ACP70R_023121 [Stipagrostis hirtigluma subsp. patula]